MMKYFVLLNILFFTLQGSGEAIPESKSFTVLAKNIDWSCLRLQVVGPCATPKPGVYLRYWEPTIVMETVKSPGNYVIKEIAPLVSPLKAIANFEMHTSTGLRNVQVNSSSASQSFNASNLQFHEVHLYDFPLKLLENAALCPAMPNTTLGVRYFSEADSVQWRMQSLEKYTSKAQIESASRSSAYHIGKWGPEYPRTGFVVHVSSAVSSALVSLRAMSIAQEGASSVHIIESPLDFRMNMWIDQMQMLHPQKTMCMSLGADPMIWERGRVSKDGTYVWLYWHYRECCKPIVP